MCSLQQCPNLISVELDCPALASLELGQLPCLTKLVLKCPNMAVSSPSPTHHDVHLCQILYSTQSLACGGIGGGPSSIQAYEYDSDDPDAQPDENKPPPTSHLDNCDFTKVDFVVLAPMPKLASLSIANATKLPWVVLENPIKHLELHDSFIADLKAIAKFCPELLTLQFSPASVTLTVCLPTSCFVCSFTSNGWH